MSCYFMPTNTDKVTYNKEDTPAYCYKAFFLLFKLITNRFLLNKKRSSNKRALISSRQFDRWMDQTDER